MTLKPLTKLFFYTLPLTFLLFLAACGDDVSAPSKLLPLAHTVTVTIGLSGSPETRIGSVDLDVILPPGFVLETDSSGQPVNSALTFLVDGAMADVNYASANGKITAAIIKTDGFAGNADLMRISGVYPAETVLPTGNSFIINAVAYSFNTTAVDDISDKINISVQLAP